MKKSGFVLICLLPLLAGAQKNFRLQVLVPGIPDNTKLYAFYFNGQGTTKDSAYMKGGKCSFAGSIPEPGKGVVRMEASGKITDIVSLYFEPGAFVLKGKDSLRTALVMGSALNDDFYVLQKSTGNYFNELVAIRTAAQQLSKEAKAGAEGNALNQRYKLLMDTLRKKQFEFVQSHPKSFVSVDVLKPYSLGIMDVAVIGSLFNGLSAELKATPSGVAFAKALAKAETVQTGSKAPFFTSYTPAGDTLHLQDVMGRSKLLLVDFWASWCGPCRAENPNMVKAYQQYHDKGFDIISISLDEKAVPWKAAIAKDNMPWYNASSLQGWKDPVVLLYGVSGIPDNFLVDAKGNIIARALRGPALEERLKEILGPSKAIGQKQ